MIGQWSSICDTNAPFRGEARERERGGKKFEMVKAVEGNRGVGQANDTE